MKNNENIDFDKLLQESKELCRIIGENDILGQKLNEIFKVLTNAMYVQNEKIKELDHTAIDYKNKYEEALKEKHELQKDYDTLYELYERKKNLLDVIQDND